MSAKELFNAKELLSGKVKSKLEKNPKLLAGLGLQGKSISLELVGPGGGAWTFSVSEDELVTLEEAKKTADCAIEMKEDVFHGILKGSVNVPFAFMTRKIKIQGDTSLAVKVGLSLQKLFKA